jgi:putative redox protein
MTLRMYADHKKWDLKEVKVHLSHSKEHAADCDNCDDPKSKIDKIEREIELEGDLDQDQKERLLEIADRCPVHRTLHGKIEVHSKLV